MPKKRPSQTLFKPGNKAALGNDGGAHRKTITQVLISQLHETNRKTGKEKLHHIVEKLIAMAMDGDIQAIKEIYDRVEGKAKQQIELSDDNKPDLGKLSVAELLTFQKLLSKATVLDGRGGGAGETEERGGTPTHSRTMRDTKRLHS